MIAAMSQAGAENPRLSPKRPLGSFHLLRDLRQQRSSFRMRFELAHVFSLARPTALRRTDDLKAAGVEFTSGDQPGVRLRKGSSNR